MILITSDMKARGDLYGVRFGYCICAYGPFPELDRLDEKFHVNKVMQDTRINDGVDDAAWTLPLE